MEWHYFKFLQISFNVLLNKTPVDSPVSFGVKSVALSHQAATVLS